MEGAFAASLGSREAKLDINNIEIHSANAGVPHSMSGAAGLGTKAEVGVFLVL